MAESATADLQQSLQQQRDKTQAIESELATARRGVETEPATSQKAADESAQLKQTPNNAQAELRGSSAGLPRAAPNPSAQVKQTAMATEPRVAADTKGSAETARLLERASALLREGNIGAARVILERAAEMGSAQATFSLAETYDPLILATWRTFGTRGDATKARELYAKAYDGGIKAGKDRSQALPTAGSEAK
jgi:hypothetical protein